MIRKHLAWRRATPTFHWLMTRRCWLPRGRHQRCIL